MRDYFRSSNKIRFLTPLDGDCLNIYDGSMREDGCLWIKVKIQTDRDRKIEVNEIPAVYNNNCFEAEVPLDIGRTTLVAKDTENNEISEKIVVFRLSKCTGIYRLSSDDNILFLQDINDHKDTYTSIFDNPYLPMYKEAHDKYGANVQLNIHYERKDNINFSKTREYFNLTMMTDKFKEEWRENSSWLHLSFHARDIFPDKPYKYTTMTEVAADAKLVYKEVVRFAGEETLSIENTTIHWGECTLDGMRALRNLGQKGAYGYFNINKSGTTSVSYFYPADFVKHLHERDFWMDTEEDILYGRIDSVLNHYSHAEDVIPVLEKIKANPHIGGCVDFMIHEQYFYEDYEYYIPEFKEIVLTACKWAKDNGYKGYFMGDLNE